MTSVANHPDFQAAGLGRAPLVIDADCPGSPTIADARYSVTRMSGAPAVVAAPSEYRLFIYVASSDQLARSFAWQPRPTPQEMLRAGTALSEITSALYLTSEELADRATLERGLTQGIGLWPAGRVRTNPAFDPAPAATPRGR